jgi:hypothetical protein
MRIHRLATALVASASCAILVASCAQRPTSEAEASRDPESDERGGECANDLGADAERTGEAADAASKEECVAACQGGAGSMEAFCRSLPPDPRLRAGCWGVVFAGEAVCIGWCLWHF